MGRESRRKSLARTAKLSVASTATMLEVDETADPVAYQGIPTLAGWYDRDSTSIDADRDEDAPAPAGSGSYLAQLVLQGRLRIPKRVAALLGVLLWGLIVGWMAIQDNGASRLLDSAGLKWFAIKAAWAGVPCLLLSILVAFFGSGKRR